MQVGAVLVLGDCIGKDVSPQSSTVKYFPRTMPRFFGTPAAMLDLLGEPVLYRITEGLQRVGVGPIFLVVDDALASHAVVSGISHWGVHVRSVPRERIRAATEEALASCRESGVRTALVMQASAYVELDVDELLTFHGATGRAVTSVRDHHGPLGIAMVDSEFREALLPERRTSQSPPPEYLHRQYANRLSTFLELRCLARDALLQRCTIQPNGSELRPGVWVAPSARLHPRVRIVNPCFIGAHTRLSSGVVITRGTNIEHHCEVDCGTVVENTTILPHTYLGSDLDIAHSIVNRNTMVDVRRAIEVEIDDYSLVSSTSPLPRSTAKPAPMRPSRVTADLSWWKLRDAFSAFLPNRPVLSPASARFSHNPAEVEPGLVEVAKASDPRAA
jgi:NDP-sugar pyrophosphorylase family protein